jgi:hypothetical protein
MNRSTGGRREVAPIPATAVSFWVIGSLAVFCQLLLIAYLGERSYVDVQRAVHFGWDVAEGRLSVTAHMDRSKTFLGPVAWYWIYQQGGLYALKALNVALFVGLLAAHRGIARHVIGSLVAGEAAGRIAVLATALFAFYPGTFRSVTASEVDDNVSHLLMGLGVLSAVSGRGVLLAGLLMGLAFLFKYWVAMLVAGFALGLGLRTSPHRWRDVLAFSLAAATPFALFNLATDFVGLRSIPGQIEHQYGYSGAPTMLVKLFSTGLLPAVAIAGWVCWRNPTDERRVLVSIAPVYLLYVIVMRDAFTATFVMVACLVPTSFLIAEWLDGVVPKRLRTAALIAYLVAGLVVATVNLKRDTRPFRLDPERFPPRPVPAWSVVEPPAAAPATAHHPAHHPTGGQRIGSHPLLPHAG